LGGADVLTPKQRSGIREVLASGPAAPPPTESKQEALSKHEIAALTFIRESLKNGRSPSVREVCRAVGLRSSRSGLRIINKLMSKRYLCRDGQGVLEML
jgi:hypothetical protein